MKGVYQITNKTNGKKYIGSSVDIRDRWRRHRSNLRRGCHENPHLQNAWNKYGKDNFVFMLLEGTENPLEREQWYLDNAIEWERDYNMARYAQGGGNPHTEEHKRKISEAATGRKLSDETKRKLSEAHTGKTLSEETKRKLSVAHRGENGPNASLTNEQVWDIHTLYATGNYNYEQLSERFPIDRSNISRIVRGERWPHIYEKFHTQYKGSMVQNAKFGENHRNAKLTNKEVREILILYATGNFTQTQLGRSFHIDPSNISRIVRGESWSHVYEKFQKRRL